MNNEKVSVYKLVSDFNKSEIYRTSIPMGMMPGWPCIHRMGKALCITIPYYSRTTSGDNMVLHSLYCSVTFPVMNPEKLMDFTVYPYKRGWENVDFENPIGVFPHESLAGVSPREYKELCTRLYGYYDKMVDAVRNQEQFLEHEEMAELLTQLMEPAHYSQYLRINKKFYSYFCNL